MTEDILKRLKRSQPLARGPYRSLVNDSITEIERLRALITAWADALDKPCDATDLALAMYDADEAGAALRKAVGR